MQGGRAANVKAAAAVAERKGPCERWRRLEGKAREDRERRRFQVAQQSKRESQAGCLAWHHRQAKEKEERGVVS